MKLVIVAVLAVVAVAVAAPPSNPQEPIPILKSSFDQQPDGPYQFAYETGNGINAQENGELKTVKDEDNKDQTVVVVRGSYSYTDDQGQQHSVTYYADETGFHAESADIPVAPVARR